MADGSNEYPPYGTDTASWETHRVATALNMINSHSDVISMSCPSGDFGYLHLMLNPTSTRNRYLNKVLFGYSLRGQLGQVIEDRGYDVLHYHGIIPAALTLDLTRRSNAASVVTWGDPHLGVNRGIENTVDILRTSQGNQVFVQFVSILAQLYILKRIDRIISVSRHLKNRLMAVYGVKGSKIDVVPPGVDTEFFRPGLDTKLLRERHSIREDEQVIVCPARMAPLKRQEELIKAVHILTRKGCSIKTVFVGHVTSMTYLERLKSLGKQLGLDGSLIFAGPVARKDFPAYYCLGSVIVLPSIGEGMASSVIEAMSCGRPIVASDIPSNREAAVNGDEVLFYPSGQAHRLADAIESVLRKEGLSVNLSTRARRTALKHFSLEEEGRLTLESYAHAIVDPKGTLAGQ